MFSTMEVLVEEPSIDGVTNTPLPIPRHYMFYLLTYTKYSYY